MNQHRFLARLLRRSTKWGFSLMEILFALAALGILAAAAVPGYSLIRDKLRNRTGIADIVRIQAEIQRFQSISFRLPGSLDEIGARLPNGGLDPWGRAYVYLNIEDGGPGVMGNVRRDHALNPINRDYDLYSLGAACPTELLCLTAFPTPHGRNSRDGYCLRRPSRPRSIHPSDSKAVTWIRSQMTLRPVRDALQVPYGRR